MIWSEITSNTAENNVSRKCYSLDNAVKQIKACHYSGSSDSYECSQSQIDMKNYDGMHFLNLRLSLSLIIPTFLYLNCSLQMFIV